MEHLDANNAQQTPAAVKLENSSLAIVTAAIDHRLTGPELNGVSPNVQVLVDGIVCATSRSSWIETLKLNGHELANVKIMSVTSRVNERSRQASVWVSFRTPNYPSQNLTREATKVLVWEVVDGMWSCVRMEMLRGCAMVAAERPPEDDGLDRRSTSCRVRLDVEGSRRTPKDVV